MIDFDEPSIDNAIPDGYVTMDADGIMRVQVGGEQVRVNTAVESVEEAHTFECVDAIEGALTLLWENNLDNDDRAKALEIELRRMKDERDR